ncbi:MAG TPA: triose-phosphate isomerase [Rhizomicrobium sp.]
MRTLIAGNWKMNGLAADLAEIAALGRALATTPRTVDVLICPPATLVARAAAATIGISIAIGGQDCAPAAHGAFTGDVSAEMLRDAGATFVILGHSERRQYHKETDAMVRAKAQGVHRARLSAIICIGETKEQRDAGKAVGIVSRQLAAGVPDGSGPGNLVIAYEPVWAIGTGVVPSEDQIAQMHTLIRQGLVKRFGAEAAGVRILYGGSMKATNAAPILALPDVNGGLIGGASLKAADLLGIIAAAPQG